MFNNKNLKIDFQQLNIYLNNKSFLNFNDEQKEIIDCYFNFLLNELNMKISEINNNIIFNLNFYHNETENNGEEFEIDFIASSQSETKINIFLLEYKHYSKFNNNQSKIKNDIEKYKLKLNKFKNYFFSNYHNNEIDIILIFGYKDQENSYEYKLFTFDENWEVKNDNKINQENKNKLSTFFKNNKWFNNDELFNDRLRDAKDINEIISCLEDDNYPFNVDAELNDKFSQKIENEKNIKYFLIEGESGTGKTLTAFSWFKKMKNKSIIWLINDKLATQIKNSLKVELKNKIFWHFNDIDNFFKEEQEKIKEEDFFIFIDEAQRIREDQIKWINELMNKFPKIKIILFGDEKQRISKNDIGYLNFFNEKNDNEKWKYSIKKYYRINKKTLNIIKYVLFLSNNDFDRNKQKLINYRILIPDTIQEFKKEFDNEFERDKNIVISSIEGTDRNNYDSKLKEINIEPASKDLWKRESFLYIHDYLNRFYAFPYDLISREVNQSFVFLGSNVKMNSEEKIIFNNGHAPYLNQLNVLLTRATKKLVVYIDDQYYREKCKERLNKIITKRGSRNE